MAVTKKIIKPVTVPGRISVDVGTEDQARTGGFTVEPGSGGGGGRKVIGTSGNITKEQAQQIERERAARKAAEQKKVEQIRKEQEKLERERQQRIEQGTISGQLNNASGTIDVRRNFDAAINSQTNLKPDARFNKERFVQAGREFFFVDGTPIDSFATLAAPLQGLFTGRKGDISFNAPSFGTIQNQQGDVNFISQFGSGGGEKTTGKKLRTQQAIVDPTLLDPLQVTINRVSRNIVDPIAQSLQEDINQGRITVQEAESQFNILAEIELSKKSSQNLIDQSLSRASSFKQNTERGLQPSFNAEGFAKFGGTLALSSIPFGSALVGGSFIYSGLPKVTGGKNLTERGLGLFEIGVGLGSGGLASRQIERQADRLLINELLEKKRTVSGKELARFDEGSIFKIDSKVSLGNEASLQSEIIFPSFRTGQNTFSISGGKGVSKINFFSQETGKFETLSESFIFGGRGSSGEGGVSLLSNGVKREFDDSFFSSFGSGFVKKRGSESFRNINFGGFSKDIENELGSFSLIKSGKLSRVKLEGVNNLFNQGRLFRNARGIYRVEEEGIIKRLSDVSDDGVRVLSPNSNVKRTPLSSTFGTGNVVQNIQKPVPPPTGITPSIENQVFGSSKNIISSVRNRATSKLVSSGSQVSKQIISNRQPQLVANTLFSSQANRQSSRNVLSNLSRSNLSLASFNINVQRSGLKSESKSSLKNQAIPSFVNTGFSGKFSPTSSFTGGILLPKLPRVSFRESNRKSQIGKQTTGYQPSVTSSVFGITATKAPNIVGVSVRPLITNSRKNRRK